MKQLALGLAMEADPGLEASVTGRNGQLRQFLSALVAGTAADRFAYLWGAPGAGRSHWLRALCGDAARAGMQCVWWPAFPDEFDSTQVGIVDDVQSLGEDEQIVLFHMFNAAREAGAAMLFSGDAPPAQLAMRADLRTRLGSCLVFQVHGLDDADKAIALAAHARGRGFDLPEDVARYLLTHSDRDLRSLVRALDLLDRTSLEQRRPLTIPLLREVLRPAGPRETAFAVDDDRH